MSGKRFEITEYGSDYYIEIIDNEKELDESIDNPSQKLGLVECVDLLNEQQSTIKQLESDKAIAEDYANIFEMENVKLRKKLNTLSEKNEQLKEQLQIIERIIETQITEKEEDLRISVKGGMPTGGLYSEIEFLEKLKKECFDE